MGSDKDIVIVGGGIVGAATMYKLQEKYPSLRILLIEKEKRLAAHQTGHNSGVIHSGIYYKPGSSKARNCVKGRRELVEFARANGIPHDVCGKLIVATEPSEYGDLERIRDRGYENGIEGMEEVDGEQIREKEPECRGERGIHVPCTGIIDFGAVTEKMVELAQTIQPESEVHTEEEVRGREREGEEEERISTDRASYKTRWTIFCCGLQSDRMLRQEDPERKERVVGFRGDYFELTENAEEKVNDLIYPVPDPKFPFLGVHFTRMIHGGVECGPNAVFTFKREGYAKTDFNFRDTLDALSYRGTWRLFFKHWRFGLDEYRRAFSKRLFLQRLRTLIPNLQKEEIQPGRSGVRAMLLDRDGEMVDDFRIAYDQGSIHVLNAPSPAATACLAIGSDIREMAERHFALADRVSP
ncbi:MAG: L-2-hydroxyglutarate oxidase [Flavobacteriales bacterium]